MKHVIKIVAKDEDRLIEVTANITHPKHLSIHEQKRKKADLTDSLFNAVRDSGFYCHEIKIK